MPKTIEKKRRMRVEIRLTPEINDILRICAAKADCDKSDVIEDLVREKYAGQTVVASSFLAG